MKDLIIVGAGGFGREVAWIIETINENEPTWNILGFVDDDVSLIGCIIGNYKILGDTNYPITKNVNIIIAIADTRIRRDIYEKYRDKNLLFPSLIHPKAEISKSTNVGFGSIICSNSVISVNSILGNFVIIDWNTTIGHDSTIGDFCTIFPSANISGNITIGTEVVVGSNSFLKQGIGVVSNVYIGAGAVVLKTIDYRGTYVGNPAKLLENKNI